MSQCPISYAEIPPGVRYSEEGLKRLSNRLKNLRDLPYSAEELRQEAIARASKMSIQGIQPKLSARLNVGQEAFEVVDSGGEYILKPQTHYPQLPENEDLTMRLAESAGIEVPLHGLLYSKDGTFTYFIRRFDRIGQQGKLAVEDFAQLSGETRDTKYDSSMERVAAVIDRYSTFPAVEKMKLFRFTIFNYLVGNEDMHLKNFSLIRRGGKIELSPAYDLVNTTIATGNAAEEIALPIKGNKRNLTHSLLVEYFGIQRLGLTQVVIGDILRDLVRACGEWERRIDTSFLTNTMKEKYLGLVLARRQKLEP